MLSLSTVSLFLRSLLFNVCGFLATIFFLLLFLPFLVFPQRYILWGAKIWVSFIFFLLKHIVNLTFEIRGNLPKTPVLVASKHQSTFETLVFHKILKHPIYFLKQELLYAPFFGWYLKKSGMIPLRRQKGSVPFKFLCKEAKKRLKSGSPLILFPEGTRTSPHARIAYKSGISMFYNALHVPVVPVALNSGCYWERRAFIKKPGCIIIEFLPEIKPGLSPKTFLKILETQIEEKSKELVDASVKT